MTELLQINIYSTWNLKVLINYMTRTMMKDFLCKIPAEKKNFLANLKTIIAWLLHLNHNFIEYTILGTKTSDTLKTYFTVLLHQVFLVKNKRMF